MRKLFKLQFILFFVCFISLCAFNNARADIIDTFNIISGDVDFEEPGTGDTFSVEITGLEIITRRTDTSILPGSSEVLNLEIISLSLIGIGTSAPYSGTVLDTSVLSMAPGASEPGASIDLEGSTGNTFTIESFFDVFLNLTFGSMTGGPTGGGPVIPAVTVYAELVSGILTLEHTNSISTTTVPVPEPGTIFLLGSGLIGLVGIRRSERG